MSRQLQIALLGLLLLTLLVTVYFVYIKRSPGSTGVASADQNYPPLGIENPALRLDLLQRIRSFEYSGRHRNIFSPSLPPPETPPAANSNPQLTGPVVPTEPPPLQLPVKFFGYSTDPRTGIRRAFFTDGDDVFIAAEGDTLLSRFRVLRIGNSSLEFEEIATKRRGTAVLEEMPPA